MNATTRPIFAEGTLLAGKYRVESVIGEGGMGVVLAARHEGLNTDVAIKLLRTTSLDDKEAVGRFVREARAAVSLRSEHVARVFDIGNLDDGQPYIVMERLVGTDLGSVIELNPPLPIAEAIDYVLQACEAIAEAHAAGIVHRDLKPKNLFLTHGIDGRPLVKVLDFGISKVEQSPVETQLTRTTAVIGSPSYMSPEQLRASRDVDARTDVWALGVILYELLTKRLPFSADTLTGLVLVVANEREVPVRALRPDCPEGIEAIVARCLHKTPEHRFQSVLELVQALEPWAQGVQATITDRIRAVASSGRLPPPSPSSANAMTQALPPTVAWGATDSARATELMTDPPPGPPRPARSGRAAGLVVGALLASAVAVGGAYVALHPTVIRQPSAAAGERLEHADSTAAPPPSSAAPPVAAPSAETSAASADAPPSPAAADSTADAPRPAPSAKAKASHPTKRSSPSRTNDLSNIGRK